MRSLFLRVRVRSEKRRIDNAVGKAMKGIEKRKRPTLNAQRSTSLNYQFSTSVWHRAGRNVRESAARLDTSHSAARFRGLRKRRGERRRAGAGNDARG